MTIQVDMAEVSRFLACSIATVVFFRLLLTLKQKTDLAKWSKEQRTLTLRYRLGLCPNRVLDYQEIVGLLNTEMQEIVYLEWRDYYYGYASPSLTKIDSIYFALLGQGNTPIMNEVNYNRTFRCWLHRPIKEETEKTPWA